MEVDPQSPSSRSTRATRSASNKRTHSPPSPTPSGRPVKRVALGVYDGVSVSIPRPTVSISGTHTPEDWVSQTGGLRINSPLPSEPALSNDDADMPMESAESVEDQSRPATIPQQQPMPPLPSSPIFSPDQYTRQYQSLLAPQPSYPISQYGSAVTPVQSATPPPDTPTIELHPPTPTQLTPVTLPGGSDARRWTARKQRFTMGPRADCEKCRLGVKGHWMHYD